MKKKAVGIILTAVMLTLTGCGSQATSVQAVSANSVNNVTEVSAITESTVAPIESATIEETSSIPESDIIEPIYIEYEDMFMAENYEELNYEKLEAVDIDSLEKMNVSNITLPKTVDLYDELGRWIGYSKPDVEVMLCGKTDKWVEVSFIHTLFYIPKDTFENVTGFNCEEKATEESSPKNNIPVTEIPAPVVETPIEATLEPVVTPEPETVVIENTKYTPEEAVAVYRSIMEANGIQWDPSITDFASWGTGWIPLEKGEPERVGNGNVVAFRRGNTVGGSWTHYYLEVTGSDTNSVYITEWHCD